MTIEKALEYKRIHYWLRTKFGKANNCKSDDCNGLSKSYHYALKHNYSHEFKRENYITLCQSCHKKYDMTDNIRLKISLGNSGENHNMSKLTKRIVLEVRKNNNNTLKYTLKMAKKYNVHLTTMRRCLNKITWKNI